MPTEPSDRQGQPGEPAISYDELEAAYRRGGTERGGLGNVARLVAARYRAEPLGIDDPHSNGTYYVMNRSGTVYYRDTLPEGIPDRWRSRIGPTNLTWPELWREQGPLYRVARGEEIG